MNLLLDLLVGTDKFRYLSTSSVEVEQVEVNVRGFSAGSHSWSVPPSSVVELPPCAD